MGEKNNENPHSELEAALPEILSGDTLKNALDFMAFLKANGMLAGGAHGEVSCKGKCMCYMHFGTWAQAPDPWTIWTEGDYSEEQADTPISTELKEIAWANVNRCTSCGCGRQPGKRKIIFGKAFENVCNADMAFYLPDAGALTCVKQLLLMRKNLVDENNL